ncbi:MAG: nitronate monooxygenase [Candidatus Melainabacteria bacterium]|nr:nitronate monooxygenase [Candidatus Melainabacteria bacterium]
MSDPVLIQGGMGAGVSNWRLAQAVSRQGHLGVVSGTALDGIFVCRLQEGDQGGHMRRALEHLPVPGLADEILSRYYRPGGKKDGEPYRHSMFKHNSDLALLKLTVAANFVEVYLAKEGHGGVVGVNYLEKIQLPTLPSLYGAMLAGVDYVLMGAGVPRTIPGILDRLANHQGVSLKLNVDGATAEDNFEVFFDPRLINTESHLPLKRPKFLGIVSSAALAATLAKKSNGRIDGFVIENPTAGGHNAPPRGNLKLDENGEPIYGLRDTVDLDEVKKLGLPFWLAGSFNTPEKLQEAIALGANGIQVGTLFAFCRESGIDDQLKRRILEKALSGNLEVFTDPLASPTGFPFKVVELEGSLSEKDVYESRPRVCNLGYLRSAYKKEDGSLGFRCPGEPVEQYLQKGGKVEDTVGRKCLCNGLVANIGFPQVQKSGYVEKVLVTSGNEIQHIAELVKSGEDSYCATAVIDYLLGYCCDVM